MSHRGGSRRPGLLPEQRRQEELVLGGRAPATVVRAAQFHEFVATLLDLVPGPGAVLPRMRLQPVAAVEVAAALAALATEPARHSYLRAMAGPVSRDDELAAAYLSARARLIRIGYAVLGSHAHTLDSIVSLTTRDGLITRIDMLRAPQKLRRVVATEAFGEQ